MDNRHSRSESKREGGGVFKGATLAEIMAATEWQANTGRGFVSILGSQGGEKIDSSKNAAGERTYKIGK